MHKSLLVASSKFFRAALKEPWEESKGLVELPKEDPKVFRVYVQYLYYGKIFSILDTTPSLETGAERIILRKLYILGDRLQDENLRNSVMDALGDKQSKDNKYPHSLAIQTYANTPPGSPLRRFLVDFHVWFGLGLSFKRHKVDGQAADVTSGPREFLLDVIEAFADAGADLHKEDNPMPWTKGPCIYHEHKDTPPCKK